MDLPGSSRIGPDSHGFAQGRREPLKAFDQCQYPNLASKGRLGSILAVRGGFFGGGEVLKSAFGERLVVGPEGGFGLAGVLAFGRQTRKRLAGWFFSKLPINCFKAFKYIKK
jgi:hypothetical protein